MKKLNFEGRTFNIVIHKDNDFCDNFYGRLHTDSQTLHINGKCHEDMSNQALVHEINHFVIDSLLCDHLSEEQKENIVRDVSRRMYGILKSNNLWKNIKFS